MDAAALLAEYRRRADDRTEPYHTSDDDVFAMLAEAERESCMRDHPLFDCDTSAIVEYAVAADATSVTLDERVLRVDHATFTPTGSTRACKLCLVGIDAIREKQDARAGVVSASRPDYAAHSAKRTMTLYPAPSEGGTLRLDVYRLPLADIDSGSDKPEIPLELHSGLVDWALYRTFSDKDSEQEDMQRAQRALADFELRFGQRRNADAMRRHRERRRVTTRNIYP